MVCYEFNWNTWKGLFLPYSLFICSFLYSDFLRYLLENDVSPAFSYQPILLSYTRNPYLLLTGLEEAGQYVDHLYIQFYNNYCHTGAGQWFTDTLNKWLAFAERMKPRGPLIFIGLPADTKGASGAQFYRPPGELRSLYQVRGRLFEFFLFLAPVVQRADNFIQRISLSSG